MKKFLKILNLKSNIEKNNTKIIFTIIILLIICGIGGILLKVVPFKEIGGL